MESKNKKLRSGYTTGACAAAAAKAAALLVGNAECGMRSECQNMAVEIPFPDGQRVAFVVHASGYDSDRKSAWASVIKDAGDDPDVTNGAEIRAEAVLSAECGMPSPGPSPNGERGERTRINLSRSAECPEIIIKGGKGVGIVTKPGLAIAVGEPAINPVPRKMIRDAVREAVSECAAANAVTPHLQITISVPNGEELAKKTLNHRLGIAGGVSILGTTGIVKPLSEAAWTATISSSFDVAKALGRKEVVLSTGRTSEKAHQKKFDLPEECYAMMGDYTEFSLQDAARHGFRRIHLCAQWAKMIKIAMETPETHVRHGAIEAKDAVVFLRSLGADLPEAEFNTVREVLDFIRTRHPDPQAVLSSVCTAAKKYADRIMSGIHVVVHLVSYEGRIIAASE